MEMKLSCLLSSCLILLALKINQLAAISFAHTGNETSSCFYSYNSEFVGTDLAKLEVLTLESCCRYCSLLKDCVAWNALRINLEKVYQCSLISEVKSFKVLSNGYNFSGWKNANSFVKCKSEENVWYHSSSMNWAIYTAYKDVDSCCHQCMGTFNNRCVSWMFNNNTNECWHSSKRLDEASTHLTFDGMISGSYEIGPFTSSSSTTTAAPSTNSIIITS